MIDGILSAIGSLIYPLFSIIYVLIDGVQQIFQAFAGTGNIRFGGNMGGSDEGTLIGSGNTGAETDTGILYYLFQSDIVQNLFLSILVLALFLIIIFTVMAFIKNAYSSKPKKWQDIVGNAFIGLANFVFIPVCCLLGVWLGNILLKAIDGATNSSGSTTISRMLFVASAYNANDIRNGNYDNKLDDLHEDVEGLINYYGLKEEITLKDYSDDLINGTEEEKEEAKAYYADIVDKVYASGEIIISSRINVSQWYSLIDINYFILAGGGIFTLYVLCAISFGMVKRMFTLLMLFVISPAMCAMYPLDDGNAVKKWKDDFVKNTISAYGAVAGLNLFFSLSPIIQKINLVGGANALDVLGLTSLLLTIAGLYVVKDFINMISNYIGAGNAYSDGAGLMGNVKKRVSQGTKWAGKRVAGATGTFIRTKAENDAAGGGRLDFVGRLLRNSAENVRDGALKNATGLDWKGMKDDIKKQKETGEKAAQDNYEKNQTKTELKTKSMPSDVFDSNGKVDKEKAAAYLDTIENSAARKKAAEKIASKMNAYIIKNKSGNLTNADKVLEFGAKLKQEETIRQNAFGSYTDYNDAITSIQGFTTSADTTSFLSSLGGGYTFGPGGKIVDGSGNKLKDYTSSELEAQRLKAESVGATLAEKTMYASMLKQHEIIDQYKTKFSAAKQGALSVADKLTALAENYNGTEKAKTLNIANGIRKVANDKNATIQTISDVLSAAVTGVTSTGPVPSNQILSNEIKNILETGSK